MDMEHNVKLDWTGANMLRWMWRCGGTDTKDLKELWPVLGGRTV